MLPNILGSTVGHHNRQRTRNLSGNINTGNNLNYHHLRHAQAHAGYLRGGQTIRQRRDSSGSGDIYSYYRETPPNLPPRPQSAEPNLSHRTASRIESLREMHGGPLLVNEPPVSGSGFPPFSRQLIGGSASNLPKAQRNFPIHHNSSLYSSQAPHKVVNPQSLVPSRTSPHPHHHHEVLYVCHGQCTGPRCDFSKSTRQMQAVTYLDPSQQAIQGNAQPVSHFRSEVVETAPSAFRKLDKKRATISQMKELLATKLETKHRQRMSRRQRNMTRDQRGNHRKSMSSNTIERDVNVAESLNPRCDSRSQWSDVNEDLSLRGSQLKTVCCSTFQQT